jgi:hypothetical protein
MNTTARRVGGEVTQRIAKPLSNPRPRKTYPLFEYHDKPGTPGERDTGATVRHG